jgi:uncharacterized protein (TIGR02996 family)
MHANFLDAIREEPENLTHRLVYADWLEEHGTTPLDAARAELIRVQIARETADPDGDDYWHLRARERVLLARWNKGLAGELRPLVRRYRFQRGFVEWIEVAGSGEQGIGERPRMLAPIRGVRPMGVGRGGLQLWPQLVEFDLSQLARWGPPLEMVLDNLPDLRALDLGGAASMPEPRPAGDASTFVPSLVRRLLGLPVPPGLRSLAMSGSLEPYAQVGEFLASPWLASLESLTLRGTTLEFMTPMLHQLSEAPAASNLRELRLLFGTTFDFLDRPGECLRNLRTLELSHCNQIWGRTADWLVRLPLPELRVLRIVGCEMADDAAERLFRNPGWPRLHTLEVRPRGRFHPRTFGALTDGPILPHLRRLVLPDIDGDSLRRIIQGRRLLSNEEETAAGAGPRRLAELVACMGHGPRDILAALAASPCLAGLTTLEVPGWTPLDLDAFDPPTLPRLSWLDLRGRQLVPALIARLRRRYGVGFRHGACPEMGLPKPYKPPPSDDIPF